MMVYVVTFERHYGSFYIEEVFAKKSDAEDFILGQIDLIQELNPFPVPFKHYPEDNLWVGDSSEYRIEEKEIIR